MPRFTVGIGQYSYGSTDGGTTWARSLREVPGRHTPVVQGDADLSRLLQARGGQLDFVGVLPCGFGVAADHLAVEDDREAVAVFVTGDGGRLWRETDLRVGSPGWDQNRPRSWPVGRFASLALPTPDGIVLAWDDPWIFDGGESHVVSSPDRGRSWEYCCLGESNPYLALDHGDRLLALNDGYFLESSDGGRTWSRRDFVVEWPVGYCDRRVALLRRVTFPERGTGYALVVHWRQGRMKEPTPDVGLLATTDGGRRWGHLQTFAGPNIGDVNERHILALRVE